MLKVFLIGLCIQLGFSSTTTIPTTTTIPHEECYISNGTDMIIIPVSLLLNTIEIYYINY